MVATPYVVRPRSRLPRSPLSAPRGHVLCPAVNLAKCLSLAPESPES